MIDLFVVNYFITNNSINNTAQFKELCIFINDMTLHLSHIGQKFFSFFIRNDLVSDNFVNKFNQRSLLAIVNKISVLIYPRAKPFHFFLINNTIKVYSLNNAYQLAQITHISPHSCKREILFLTASSLLSQFYQ